MIENFTPPVKRQAAFGFFFLENGTNKNKIKFKIFFLLLVRVFLWVLYNNQLFSICYG